MTYIQTKVDRLIVEKFYPTAYLSGLVALCSFAGILTVEFVSKSLFLMTLVYVVVAQHLIKKLNNCYLDGSVIWNRFLLIGVIVSLLLINHTYGFDFKEEFGQSLGRTGILIFVLLFFLLLVIARPTKLATEVYFLHSVADYLLTMIFCFLAALLFSESVFHLMLTFAAIVFLYEVFQDY